MRRIRADTPNSPLPPSLCELLAREGLSPAHSVEVTTLGRRESPRLTFRVELADGRVVKARTLRGPEVAQRMARWLPRVAPHGFAALLAIGGAATLEEWVEGPAADAADADTAEAAGALLGACHAALPAEIVPADDPRLAAWSEDVARWLGELLAAGHLAPELAADLRARLADARPRRARHGLYHGDFAPENLVASAGGLRCVDNTTVRPHLLEIDAAFSMNRWPLDGALRERFLRGYRRRADPDLLLESEGFWRIGAALRSAAYRVRQRTGALELPLGEIARLVA